MIRVFLLFVYCLSIVVALGQEQSWIRINQLGYLPQSKKVAVWVTKESRTLNNFKVINSVSNQQVLKAKVGKKFGAYGPFAQGYRLDFSALNTNGTYYILTDDGVRSPNFRINDDVYKGTADFVLRYMRQQRTLFNPFLQDSCHTHDGFTMYAQSVGLPDSTHIDAGGGWHDASDYLQYSTTSANATYHLLAAYRDFPQVFTDVKIANGLDGKNGIPDIMDEAKWGLDWLLKMHPQPNMMFNQIADDRDHVNLRLPGQDSLYGRGHERPVYFIDGKPQQRGKFMNNTTGTSSTAAKFVAAFGLGHTLFNDSKPDYARLLKDKVKTAYEYAYIKPGVTQTVSVKSPYIYAEDNWVDDMELAEMTMYSLFKDKQYLTKALDYAQQEKVTPWMIRDTANHYQYYPFINLGHYELGKNVDTKEAAVAYYKEGIDQVWNRAKDNVFYRGVPFIWCSNNLTTSFAIQCQWYKELTEDDQYDELAQANIDWLFGVNPWGTSMVYGLPANGDTPEDPHSAFTYLHQFPIDGGLVDGPVYANTFNNLIGIKLNNPDEYADFQSDLVVYHDDYGDYSTNEPTMDGTASLIYLLAASEAKGKYRTTDKYGAIVKGDTTLPEIALVFTGDEFSDGLPHIAKILKKNDVKGAFFVTGRFLEDTKSAKIIRQLIKEGHYVGPHSDQHLLYAPWDKRDSLLISKEEFVADLKANVLKLQQLGMKDINMFIPPYEWYNKQIVDWSAEMGLDVYNYTPGIRTPADYTYPQMDSRYMSSDKIIAQLQHFESENSLNGGIVLIHIGTDPRREDKLYNKLAYIIKDLRSKKYKLVSLNKM